ncbi:MAG: hypothetical protein KAQ87_02225 [Candidatus Pacebacteria bacterium]|nr:hypothetical protein [Candidatus Paceibacterota bacterium]
MKTSSYLIVKKNKYIIKNDFESFSLFYMYFLFRPQFRLSTLKKIFSIFDKFLFKILKLFFILKINKLFFIFFKRKYLNKEFLIQRIGTGRQPSIVELSKNDKQYYIIKKFHNAHLFKKEVLFLQKYFENKSSIKFPAYKIVNNNQIRYEFIQIQNLATQIRLGYFKFEEIIDIYNSFCNSLDKLFKNQTTLIHGDLTPDNIYYHKNNFYVIDYSDSHLYDKDYDKFILLERLSSDYFMIGNKKKIREFNKFSKSKIKLFRTHRKQCLEKKHF